jgi:hypothetical protein
MDVSGNTFLEHVLNDLSGAALDIDNVLVLAKSLALKVKAAKELKLDQKVELVQKTLRAALDVQKDLDPAVIASVASVIDNVVPHTVIVSAEKRWATCVHSWSLCKSAKNVLPPSEPVVEDATQKKEEVSTPAPVVPATSEQA